MEAKLKFALLARFRTVASLTKILFVGLLALSVAPSSVALSVTAQEPNVGDTKPGPGGEPFAAETTVGMSGRVEAVVLPGERLVVKKLESRHEPLVLRITDTYKHGTDHRYDLEFYALEPGDYNLSDYLIPAESDAGGTVVAELAEQTVTRLPAVWVKVISTLPDGQITPNELQSVKLPYLGGYWLFWLVGGGLWLVGLIALLKIGRSKRNLQAPEKIKVVSMAEHLRPLVEAAIRGDLHAGGRAELERSLIAYWCKRLNLQGREPSEVMGTLREDAEAGPLLRSLEDWLHRPDPPRDVDVEALLAPYKNISDEEFRQVASVPSGSTRKALVSTGDAV